MFERLHSLDASVFAHEPDRLLTAFERATHPPVLTSTCIKLALRFVLGGGKGSGGGRGG